MAASLDCLMKREEKIHRCCPLPGATAESHQRRANGITSDSELRPCITLPSLWTSTNISLVGVRLWRSRLFPRVPWLNTRFVSRFVVCVGFQDLQRLLGTARQQGCSTVVLGSAANNLVGNIGNIFPQNYPQIVRFAGVPRGRHKVLPRLVVRERYFREGKCREENHGTSPWDGGPDAIGDTRHQYLSAVQCTFACTRLVGTCQRASRTTRLVVRCVRL